MAAATHLLWFLEASFIGALLFSTLLRVNVFLFPPNISSARHQGGLVSTARAAALALRPPTCTRVQRVRFAPEGP